MIELLKKQGAIRSEQVEEAFRRVERHRFIEAVYEFEPSGTLQARHFDPENPTEAQLDTIYQNRTLVTRVYNNWPTSSSSEPGIVAEMLELIDVGPGLKVLEIGAGTGYNAALMAEVVKAPRLVVSIDVQEDIIAQTARLLENAGYGEVKLVAGDGAADEAPFDRIVATVGCPDISPAWGAQLNPSGRMLIPLQHAGWYPLTRIWAEKDGLMGRVVGWSGFMLIQGTLATEGPWPFTHSGGLTPSKQAKELPLFEGFNNENWSEEFPIWNFFYFVGLEDSRAFWTSQTPGFGLVDKRLGTAIVNPKSKSVFLDGDQQLYSRLNQIYERWLSLGRPRPSDFQMEFVPVGSRQVAAGAVSSTWVIERKLFTQVVTLLKADRSRVCERPWDKSHQARSVLPNISPRNETFERLLIDLSQEARETEPS